MAFTVVTGFWELKIRENNANRRGSDDYLSYGRKLIEVPLPMVIFIEPCYYTEVWKIRRDAGLLDRTYFIALPFESLPAYKYFFRFEEILKVKKNDRAKLNIETVGYKTICWSKIELMEEAVKINPFGTTHYCWVDYGIAHVCDPSPIASFSLSSKFKLQEVRPLSLLAEYKDKESFNTIRYAVAGGIMMSPIDHLKRVSLLFQEHGKYLLEIGICPNEEEVINYIYLKNPELFEVFYGDYQQIACNFNRITSNTQHLIKELRWARAGSLHEKIVDIAGKMLSSIKEGLLAVNELERSQIYDEYYIGCWYTGRKDECRRIARKIVKRAESVENFWKEILSRFDHFRYNLGFLPIEDQECILFLIDEKELKNLQVLLEMISEIRSVMIVLPEGAIIPEELKVWELSPHNPLITLPLHWKKATDIVVGTTSLAIPEGNEGKVIKLEDSRLTDLKRIFNSKSKEQE